MLDKALCLWCVIKNYKIHNKKEIYEIYKIKIIKNRNKLFNSILTKFVI